MSSSQEESELVRRARAGDQDAFTVLCRTHRVLLWRVVTSVARGTDREDLAQQAIVQAFRSLRTFRGEAPFGAWLCRIAINVAHDYQKSAWRRRTVALSELGDAQAESLETPQELVERREMQRRVRQAVAALPEAQRIAIWLYYFEEFSLVEISRLERSAESTIRSRVQAGLRRLAPSLQDLLATAECPGIQPVPPKGCET